MPFDLTSGLGRLLADPGLRAELRNDPEAAARKLGAAQGDLAGLDLEGLEQQASTLVEKRFHEVAKLLPATFAGLHCAAKRHFGDYAPTYWPTGHRRHDLDADAFARFLEDRGVKTGRAEVHQLRFSLQERRWSMSFVPDAWVDGKARPALQLLFRRGGGVRALAFYFEL